MKAKWGMVVVAGRGKIGGHVASQNRSGAYFRTKVTPVNPQSSAQVNVRSRLSGNSSGWRGLTEDQRLAWNNAVSDYKRTDIFGDIQSPSGFNLYVKLNSNLANIGIASIITPPLPVAVSTFDTGTLTGASGTPALSLAVTPSTQPTAETIIVFATPALSAGKSFVKSEFRQIGTFTAATTGAYNLLSMWNAKFGSMGAVGTKIFVKVVHVNETTGQQSQAQMYSIVIAS